MPTLIVSAETGNAMTAARLHRRNVFFRRHSVFFISIVECGFGSVSGYLSAFGSCYADTPLFEALMLPPEIQHPMCHVRIFNVRYSLFGGFRHKVFANRAHTDF